MQLKILTLKSPKFISQTTSLEINKKSSYSILKENVKTSEITSIVVKQHMNVTYVEKSAIQCETFLNHMNIADIAK